MAEIQLRSPAQVLAAHDSGAPVPRSYVDTAVAPVAPVTFSSAATLTLDVAGGRKRFRGALTVNSILAPPVNGVDGQQVLIAVQASGANRVLSLDPAIIKVTEKTFPFTIVSGKRLFLGLTLEGTSWVLLAAGLEP